MASTAMAVAGSAAVVLGAPVRECMSSSAAFGSPAVHFAPVAARSGVKGSRVVAVRASQAPEESKAARREVLTGLFAAGALLASTPAYAISGPGGNGAEKVAKKAGDLLKDADKLTKNDSPPTYGRGGVQGAIQEAGSTASQAGAGAKKNVGEVADAAVKNARDNLNKAKASFGDLMGKDKVSSSSSAIKGAKGKAQSAIGDAKSNASSAAGDAKGALSSLGDKITGNTASNVASNVQSKAGNALSGAKSKVDSASISLPEKKEGQKF